MRINLLLEKSLKVSKLTRLLNFNFTVKNDPFLNKEIKLLSKTLKGQSLLTFTLVTLIILALIYYAMSMQFKRNSTIEFLIFMLAGGYSMAEYLQYILSWDYKNFGSIVMLPLDYRKLIITKLKMIYILLFFHGLLSWLIIGSYFYPSVIYLFYIFNFLILPHFYMLIALSSYRQNMYLEMSIMNVQYYQRPIKLLVSLSVLFLIEYLLFFVLPPEAIRVFMVILVTLSTLLSVFFYKKIINYYNNRYIVWLNKYSNLKESSYA